MNSVIILISIALAFNIMRASVYPAKRNSSHSMAWICSGFFIQCMLLGVFYSALSYIFLYTAISSLWLMSVCAFIAWQQCEIFYLIYQSHTFNKKTARIPRAYDYFMYSGAFIGGLVFVKKLTLLIFIPYILNASSRFVMGVAIVICQAITLLFISSLDWLFKKARRLLSQQVISNITTSPYGVSNITPSPHVAFTPAMDTMMNRASQVLIESDNLLCMLAKEVSLEKFNTIAKKIAYRNGSWLCLQTKNTFSINSIREAKRHFLSNNNAFISKTHISLYEQMIVLERYFHMMQDLPDTAYKRRYGDNYLYKQCPGIFPGFMAALRYAQVGCTKKEGYFGALERGQLLIKCFPLEKYDTQDEEYAGTPDPTEAIMQQLVDPKNFRPCPRDEHAAHDRAPGYGATTKWVYNPNSEKWVSSTIPAKVLPKNTEKDHQHMQKTSTTLISPIGRTATFGDYPVAFAFDMAKCKTDDQYTFSNNAITYMRWWLGRYTPTEIPSSVPVLQLQNIICAMRNERAPQNEILARPSFDSVVASICVKNKPLYRLAAVRNAELVNCYRQKHDAKAAPIPVMLVKNGGYEPYDYDFLADDIGWILVQKLYNSSQSDDSEESHIVENIAVSLKCLYYGARSSLKVGYVGRFLSDVKNSMNKYQFQFNLDASLIPAEYEEFKNRCEKNQPYSNSRGQSLLNSAYLGQPVANPADQARKIVLRLQEAHKNNPNVHITQKDLDIISERVKSRYKGFDVDHFDALLYLADKVDIDREDILATLANSTTKVKQGLYDLLIIQNQNHYSDDIAREAIECILQCKDIEASYLSKDSARFIDDYKYLLSKNISIGLLESCLDIIIAQHKKSNTSLESIMDIITPREVRTYFETKSPELTGGTQWLMSTLGIASC